MVQRVLLSAGSLVLLFALLALVGIYDALTPQEAGPQPGSRSQDPDPISALAQSGSQVDGQLCVVVEGQRLRARFELLVPAQASLVSGLWRSGGPSGLDLVNAFLGQVQVAQFTEWPSHDWRFEPLSFGSPRLISDGRGRARIETESDSYFFGTRKVSFLVDRPLTPIYRESRTITVDTHGMEIYADQPTAKLSETLTSGRAQKGATTGPACGMSLGTGMTRYFYLLNDPSGIDPPRASFILNRDHGASWWTSDVANDGITAVDAVLWIGAGAFPYALAAWYLRRTRLRRSELTTSLLCVFWLLVATGALWTMKDLLESRDVFRDVARTFARVTGNFDSYTGKPSVVVADSMLLIGALAWPLMTWTVNRSGSRPSARSWSQLALAMVPAAVAAGATAVVATVTLNGWSHQGWAKPWTYAVAAALGAVIAGALTLFLNEVAPTLASWWAAVFGAAAVGVAAIGPSAFTTLYRGWSYLVGLTYFIAVLSLAAGGLILLLRCRAPRLSRSLFTAVSVVTYVLAVGALIFPHVVDLSLHSQTSASPWSVLPLAQDLESLLYVVVLVCFLVALARTGAVRGIIRSAGLHRTLGVLFVVLNFYWFQDRWFYLPVPVLLGWLLAARWLFPKENVKLVVEVRRDRASTRTSAKDEGEELLELSRAERRHRALVTAGTRADLRMAEKRLRIARGVAARREPPLRERFFGVPDTGSPWEFGKLGAALGVSLGVPWIALYLTILARDGFGFGVVPAERYPALWIFGQVFGILTQWPLFGFALGYFFPYLRGANAVTKSLSLSATATLPPVALTLLWWRQDMIVPILWWAVQTFIFAVALGMVMDYRLVRRTAIDHSTYIELRGLTTVIGWGGAVVGGTITAAFALAQGTASLYVQNLLHLSSGGPGH